jgi:hypothetical protein
METRQMRWILLPILSIVLVSTMLSAAQHTVTIEKPKARTTTGGVCRIVREGTLSAFWGPMSLPTLAIIIGPGSPMDDVMHANKAKFTGPGKYSDVIIAVYLGKTALEDSYSGLGTIVFMADNTGTFELNDHSASGHFDCGGPPARN